MFTRVVSGKDTAVMSRVSGVVAILMVGFVLSGCAAMAIVDTAVGVTTTVVDTTVDVAAGAVEAVVGSSEDEEDLDCKDEDKEKDACKDKKKEAE